MALSMRDAVAMKNRIMSLQRHSRTLRHKSGEAVRDAVHLAEVGVGAGALGYWHGKRAADSTATEAPSFFGVPAEIVATAVLYGAAWMGVAGAEDHFKSLGDGAWAAYAASVGYEAGKGVKTLRPPKVLGTGTPTYGKRVSGEALTAEDLAKLAARG